MARGAGCVAVTDHDTLAGLREARGAALDLGVEFLAGVELSVSVGSESVHLLGYGFDPHDPALLGWMDGYRGEREWRARETVARLARLGVGIDTDAVEARIAVGVIARPHLAQALVDAGSVATVREAFETWLGDGRPACVPMPRRDAREAIERVHAAGGLVSVAHPGDWTAHGTIRALVAWGMDALEAWHPSHDARLEAYYLDLAERWGLAVTGGTDDHGADPPPPARGVPEPQLSLLRERLRLARLRAGRTA